jgi:oxalate decarboxylase/phosphoglucose isomerase-like protein (cupin superfamily)
MSRLISSAESSPRERVSVGGDEIIFRVTSEESAGALCVLDLRMPPGSGPPMLHRHDAFELYRVDRGELALYIEDDRGMVRRQVAGPGALIAIPGRREHTIRNESGDEARAFVIFSPGDAMERFAREAGALAEHGKPEIDEVLALASAHGIEITRPLERMD